MKNYAKICKGMENTPDYLSTRIIYTMIFFGGVVIFQNFNASYTSFLAVVTDEKPFETVQQLYEDTDFTIGTPEGWASREIFRVIVS